MLFRRRPARTHPPVPASLRASPTAITPPTFCSRRGQTSALGWCQAFGHRAVSGVRSAGRLPRPAGRSQVAPAAVPPHLTLPPQTEPRSRGPARGRHPVGSRRCPTWSAFRATVPQVLLALLGDPAGSRARPGVNLTSSRPWRLYDTSTSPVHLPPRLSSPQVARGAIASGARLASNDEILNATSRTYFGDNPRPARASMHYFTAAGATAVAGAMLAGAEHAPTSPRPRTTSSPPADATVLGAMVAAGPRREEQGVVAPRRVAGAARCDRDYSPGGARCARQGATATRATPTTTLDARLQQQRGGVTRAGWAGPGRVARWSPSRSSR